MSGDGQNDATWVVGLLALCGPEFGGAAINGSVEGDFLTAYSAANGKTHSLKVVTSGIPVETLTGSLDLASTLALGKPSYTQGLLMLDEHAGLLIRRAERLDPACASACATAVDDKMKMLLAVVDFDDGEVFLAPKLSDRLTFLVHERAVSCWKPDDIEEAKSRLSKVSISVDWVNQFVHAAMALGINSPRTVIQAVAVARCVAALSRESSVNEHAVEVASRLVFAHRATRIPSADNDEETNDPPPQNNQSDSVVADSDQDRKNPEQAEVIVEAVKASLPVNILQDLLSGKGRKGASRNMKAAAARLSSGQRGRRIGHKRAASIARQRLDILATLRSAAPWQPFRRMLAGVDRLVVTRDDFRVSRIKQRNESTAIFVVDASGSTAFQRLAEAKGAVEAILSECYVRRDKAALVSFRSKTAEVLLPPTRSLERARRALASLPGGGGTPLAAGLDQAFQLALQVRRAGGVPTIILLTDGRANVTRDGEGNKVKAIEEMLSAARLFAAEGFDAMVIDVSPDPQKHARNLAEAMQAQFLPMPRAGAVEIAQPVRRAMMANRS